MGLALQRWRGCCCSAADDVLGQTMSNFLGFFGKILVLIMDIK
jgi:hypothetical protein